MVVAGRCEESRPAGHSDDIFRLQRSLIEKVETSRSSRLFLAAKMIVKDDSIIIYNYCKSLIISLIIIIRIHSKAIIIVALKEFFLDL